MSLSVRGTSIEHVRPDDIDRVHQLAFRRLADLKSALNSDLPFGEEMITRLVNELFADLPPDLTQEIQKTHVLKQKILHILRDVRDLKKNPEDKITDRDMELVVGRLIRTVFEHQVQGLLANRTLDREEPPVNYDPVIHNRYNSLQLQRALEAGVWLISTFTSWLGLTHYIGMGLAAAEKTFTFSIPEDIQVAMRHVMAVVFSVGVSQVVQNFKRGVEKESHEKSLNIVQATIEQIRRSLRGGVLAVVLAGMAGGAMVFDLGTNINGVVTGATQRKSLSAQLDDVEAEVNERVTKIEAQVVEARKAPTGIGEKVDEILTKEREGDSETGAPGEGPVFHAKNLLYKEEAASDRALDKGPLAKNLEAEIRKTDLIDGKTLEQETEKIVSQHTHRVENMLEGIATKLAALDPTKDVEYVQKDVDAIVKSVSEAVAMLNEDLPEEIEGHLGEYNALNQRLVELIRRSGNYPNLAPDKVEGWTLPNLEIDNSPIEVGEIEYVGFENMAKVLRQKFTGNERAAVLTLALIIGFLASYADLITLRWTREAYRTDKQQASNIQNQYGDYFENKLIDLLMASLNRGPFSRYFKGEVAVKRESIKEILDEYLEEKSVLGQDNSAYRSASQFLPLSTWADLRGYTEVAQRHNARTQALLQLLKDPRILGELICRILPGNRFLDDAHSGETVAGMRKHSYEAIEARNGVIDQRLKEERVEQQQRKLEEHRQDLQRSHRAIKDPALRLDGLRIQEQFVNEAQAGVAAMETEIEPANKENWAGVKNLCANVVKDLKLSCLDVFARECTGFTLTEAQQGDITILDGNKELYQGFGRELLALEFQSLEDRAKRARTMRAIGEVLRNIDALIMAVERKGDEIERLEEANAEEAEVREVMKQVEEWFDERKTLSGAMDRMGILVEALGEHHIDLRRGRPLTAGTAARLQRGYDQWNNTVTLQLTRVVTEDLVPDDTQNPTLISVEDLDPRNIGDRLLMMSTFLEADFKILKEKFFPRGPNPDDTTNTV